MPNALPRTAVGLVSIPSVLYQSSVDTRPPNSTLHRPIRSIITYIGDLDCQCSNKVQSGHILPTGPAYYAYHRLIEAPTPLPL